jgi:hypothetical protein
MKTQTNMGKESSLKALRNVVFFNSNDSMIFNKKSETEVNINNRHLDYEFVRHLSARMTSTDWSEKGINTARIQKMADRITPQKLTK